MKQLCLPFLTLEKFLDKKLSQVQALEGTGINTYLIYLMPTDTILMRHKEVSMKRTRLNKAKDRKVFRATTKTHPSNTVNYVMRGGIRR